MFAFVVNRIFHTGETLYDCGLPMLNAVRKFSDPMPMSVLLRFLSISNVIAHPVENGNKDDCSCGKNFHVVIEIPTIVVSNIMILSAARVSFFRCTCTITSWSNIGIKRISMVIVERLEPVGVQSGSDRNVSVGNIDFPIPID